MTTAADRVFRQIESSAALYTPGTYAGLLSFYNDYDIAADPASGQFIPLTTVTKLHPRDRLLFAVGIIPPASFPSGRVLDRTASIAAITGLGDTDTALKAPTPATEVGKKVSKGGKNAARHRDARPILIEAFKRVMGREPTLAELQYAHAVGWLETRYGMGWGGAMVGSNNWGAVHCTKAAAAASSAAFSSSGGVGPGGNPIISDCIAYKDKHVDGQEYDVSFKNYASKEDGAADLIKQIFIVRPHMDQALGSGGSIFQASYAMRRGKYYGGFCLKAVKQYGAHKVRPSFGDPDRDEATAACAKESISDHAKAMSDIINEVAAANKDSSIVPLGSYEDADAWYRSVAGLEEGPVQGDSESGSWKDEGSKKSKEVQYAEASPLLSTPLADKFADAQRAQAAELQDAIERMANTPPLKMLVNPSSFSVKGEKITQDGNWGRQGPIIEHWGDGQDKISASGKVAAFFAQDVFGNGGPGLTRHARNYSESWQNFYSLYMLYRNNGAVFQNDYVNQGKRNLSLMGSIYIYYDSILYIGSFDTFNITENDTNPHTVEYSFEFTVRAVFILDRTDDEFTYGAPGLFRRDTVPTNSTVTTPSEPSGDAERLLRGLPVPGEES